MKRALLLMICLIIAACAATPTQIPRQISITPLDSDSELQAAFQHAQDTLDSFIQRIETTHPNRTLVAVKVRFLLPDGSSQDLWVDQITYEDGLFRGVMGDDIPALKLSMDDKIKIESKDIVDWMIVEDGKLVGGYTIRLAFQRMTASQKKRFLETINYSIAD
jgi:uncharacterized protein YegJ (DUF2314 family)